MKKYWATPLLLCLLLSGCGVQTEEIPQTDSIEMTETSAVTETAEDTTELPETVPETMPEATEPAATEPDVSEVSDWQKAYQEIAADYEEYMADISVEYELDTPRVGSYSLIWLNDDEIPELVVTADAIDLGGKLYTWYQGEAVPAYEWTGIRVHSFWGYEPYSGRFRTHGSGGAAYTIFQEFQLENGSAVLMESIQTDNISADSDEIGYFLNGELVSDAIGEERMDRFMTGYSELEYLTYEELMAWTPPTAFPDWQSAYAQEVQEFEEWLAEINMENDAEHQYDAKYSLLYIDADDTPELLINSYASQYLYTFSHGSAVRVNGSASYRDSHFGGYQEKSGQYWLYSSAGSDSWGYSIMELENGSAELVGRIQCYSKLQGKYFIDWIQVTQEEAEQRLAEYQALETEYEVYTSTEMLALLTE